MYDLPPEIDVQADGALRIITLNRPDSLNSVNDALHVGLAQVWTRLGEDREARAAVITGAGRAFSAGGDFEYLEELRQDADLRAKTILHGREIVLGMARCRIPVVAAVNGPAVGLGCSLVALSRHRLHERGCVPRRPACAGRVGGRRRRAADVAAADEPAAGQGVRVDRCADLGRSAPRSSGWRITSSKTRWPRRWRAPRRSWSCRGKPSKAPSGC